MQTLGKGDSSTSHRVDAIPGVVICLDEVKGERVATAIHTSLGGAISPVCKFMGTDGRDVSRTGRLQPPKRTRGGNAHCLLSVPASDAISDSHMRAWEHFLSNYNAPACAFFEDDAFVEGGVTPEMAAARVRGALREIQTSAPCDVLFLGHFESPVFIALHWLIGKLTLREGADSASTVFTRKPKVAVGAHAYILTREGAHKALIEAAAGHAFLYSSDFYLQSLASRGLIRTRVLSDRLVFQTSTARMSLKEDGVSSSTSPTSSKTAEWARGLGIVLPNTHFPTLICDVLFGKYDVDKYVSARYVLAFEVVRLFRLPAFSITTASILMLVVASAAALLVVVLPIPTRTKLLFCLLLLATACLVLIPDLVVGIFSGNPFVSVLKVLFHWLLLSVPYAAAFALLTFSKCAIVEREITL